MPQTPAAIRPRVADTPLSSGEWWEWPSVPCFVCPTPTPSEVGKSTCAEHAKYEEYSSRAIVRDAVVGGRCCFCGRFTLPKVAICIPCQWDIDEPAY